MSSERPEREPSLEVTVVLGGADARGAEERAWIAAARAGLSDAAVAGEVLVAPPQHPPEPHERDASAELPADARIVDGPGPPGRVPWHEAFERARGELVLAVEPARLAGPEELRAVLPALLAALREGADLVVARRPAAARTRADRLVALVLRRLFRVPLTDVLAGLRGFPRAAVDTLDLRCTGLELWLELAIKTSLRGKRAVEVEVPSGRAGGAPVPAPAGTPSGFREAWAGLRFAFMYSPRWLFLVPGLALMLLGVLGYALALPGVTVFGATLDAHTLLVASLALLLGYQSVVFAVVAKTFAITEGLLPQDPRLTRFYRFFSLEKGLALAAGAVALGVGLIAVAALRWRSVEFGGLDYARTMRWVIPGVTATALGFQTFLWGSFASLLGTSRRDATPLTMTDLIHEGLVHGRRARVLTRELARLLPPDARVLDVGAGDGLLAATIMRERGDVTIRGIDLAVRRASHVPVTAYDGRTLPFEDDAFDVVMLVDVLHHTPEPERLLSEARRVARRWIVLKDHTCEGRLAHLTLRLMDRVGNARHGVSLHTDYWPRRRWQEAFARLQLPVSEWTTDLGLYPAPADWVFGRSLHFVARLGVGEPAPAASA